MWTRFKNPPCNFISMPKGIVGNQSALPNAPEQVLHRTHRCPRYGLCTSVCDDLPDYQMNGSASPQHCDKGQAHRGYCVRDPLDD